MSDLWKNAFDSVHAEEQLKSHTKEYLRRKVYGPRKNRRPLYGGIAMAALCLMMVVFLGGHYLYTDPAAYIYMDGEVSVALSVNRFGQVVGARGYDSGGNALSGLSDVVHLDYGEAVEKILDDETAEGYLENTSLMVTVSGKDEALCREILDTVSADTSGYDNIRYQLENEMKADDGSIKDSQPADTSNDRQSTDTREDSQSVDTTDFIQSDGESVQIPQSHHSEGEGHNHRYGQ